MRKCPSCRQKFDPERDRRWLPFCSERCKLIDLGAWLNEDHRISSDEMPDLPPREDNDTRH